MVVTNDVHYDRPEGRELQDVLTAIRHGRSLAELLDLRRPDGESYLKGAEELLALPPGEPSTGDADPVLARAWREGIAASAEIAAGLPGRPRVRALPVPGLPRAQGRDAVQPPVRAVLGGGAAPLPPDDAGASCASSPTSWT